MELSEEQRAAVAMGRAVRVTVAGRECVLLPREAYERLVEYDAEYDARPWTLEEMELLAAEAERIISESEEALYPPQPAPS